MSDPFATRAGSLDGPGHDYAPVTPADGADLPDVAIALFVESGGSVAFTSVKGESRTVTVPDFGWILCGVRAVAATGTTASGIHAITLG